MTTFDRIATVIEESLGSERDEITPNAHLLTDLGAESIDMLDILFRIENAFGVQMERDELFPAFLFKDGTEFVQNGKLTADGVRRAYEQFPFLRAGEVTTETEPKALMTVGFLCGFVDHRLAHKAVAA